MPVVTVEVVLLCIGCCCVDRSCAGRTVCWGLGLGWRIDQDNAQRLRWHHAGGQDGARASLLVYPKQKLSIALAANVTGLPGDVNGPSAKLADAWLEASAAS